MIDIINNINANFIITDDYQKTLHTLEELQLYFINNEITITTDIADKLLKINLNLYNLIGEIVTKNYTLISDGDIELLFDDENWIYVKFLDTFFRDFYHFLNYKYWIYVRFFNIKFYQFYNPYLNLFQFPFDKQKYFY